MTILIEDGSGVQGANSYASIAEITAYLTDRGRQAENSWDTAGTPAQEAAAIAATDFIENRFSLRFKGVRKWRNIAEARTLLTFTAQPLDTETVVLGATTYTFKTTPVTPNTDVQIGDSLAESILNLALSIEAINTEVNGFAFFGDTLFVAALVAGTAGNGIATTTTVTDATFSFATTRGGNDTSESQPLSFPRANLFSREGNVILNIPARLKQAVSEYATRALLGVLQNDVVPDTSGRVTTATKVKVGPIETETKFQESTSVQIAIYPAADSLLAGYLNPSGGVMR